jgi:hypothetical protein
MANVYDLTQAEIQDHLSSVNGKYMDPQNFLSVRMSRRALELKNKGRRLIIIIIAVNGTN